MRFVRWEIGKGRWHYKEKGARQGRKGTDTQDEGSDMDKGTEGEQHSKERSLGWETGRHRKKKVTAVATR